jgi:hypothetical protein
MLSFHHEMGWAEVPVRGPCAFACIACTVQYVVPLCRRPCLFCILCLSTVFVCARYLSLVCSPPPAREISHRKGLLIYVFTACFDASSTPVTHSTHTHTHTTHTYTCTHRHSRETPHTCVTPHTHTDTYNTYTYTHAQTPHTQAQTAHSVLSS